MKTGSAPDVEACDVVLIALGHEQAYVSDECAVTRAGDGKLDPFASPK